MRDLNYELKQLCRRNRDGSYATQANRIKILNLIANQLHEAGYKKLHAQQLKGRHVYRLIQIWQEQDISTGTIKNRMAALRWWAEKVNRGSVIAKDNSFYSIPNRNYLNNESKAINVSYEQLNLVKDPWVRASLLLQREFGLRREEAIKIQPHWADRKNQLVLKSSWTKGGKERAIPIRTESQKMAIAISHQLVGKGSLIPPNKSYIQQLKSYERHTLYIGLSKVHGLRHRYAQNRYFELTSWKSPAAGGPKAKELNLKQLIKDQLARQQISRELGHERIQIISVYLGR